MGTSASPRRVAGLLAVAFVTVFLVGSASANAATYYGCVKKKGGGVRLVARSVKCRASERRISFNSQGAPGRSGANGSNGSNGANGVNGVNGSATFAGTLPSGQTIRGDWAVNSGPSGTIGFAGISFLVTLASEPAVHIVGFMQAPPPACAGGTVALPQATPGSLCLFEAFQSGAQPHTLNAANEEDPNAGVTGVLVDIEGPTSAAGGTWAVTAP